MSDIIKYKRGTSLIEIMVAIVVLAMIIIGGSALFSYSRGQIQLQKYSRMAVQLAAQKLEELKAGNYNDIAADSNDIKEDIALDDFLCTRSTLIVDTGLYKQVAVVVQWGSDNQKYEVSLNTFIAPK